MMPSHAHAGNGSASATVLRLYCKLVNNVANDYQVASDVRLLVVDQEAARQQQIGRVGFRYGL